MAGGYHERLRSRLNAQRAEMRNGDYIRHMIDDARTIILENSPTLTGTLRRNITERTPIRENKDGFVGGLGPRSSVGYEDRGAPRGTIRAFLRDFPQFRKKDRGKGDWFHPSEAWKELGPEGQRVLQEQREAGNYGGLNQGVAAGKSAYFFPQEGSFPDWSASGKKANIFPQGFVKRSLDEWRELVLPAIIRQFKVRFGSK